VPDRELVGQLARVVSRVRGPAGPGEVRVLLRGCYEILLAYSDSCFEPGEEVLVIDHRSSGSVDVVPWPLTTVIMGPEGSDNTGVEER
jgi:hypothetical protein